MKPAWDALGDKYASSSSVVIADVDCTVEQDLCSTYDVKGYPTIKYFTSETDAKGADYQGARSASDIVQWTQQQAMIGKAKALAGQAVGKVADGVKSGLSKLGLSKVAARQEGAVAAAAA